jgi:predicted helicase
MDDETLFGPTVYRLGYGEAVRRGVVSPLKLVVLDMSDEYRAWSGQLAIEAHNNNNTAQPPAAGQSAQLVLQRSLSELCKPCNDDRT